MNKLYLSSTGSGDISLTFKGVITAFIPLIILLGKQYDWNITEGDITSLIAILTAFIASIQVVLGLGRKLYIVLKKGFEIVFK